MHDNSLIVPQEQSQGMITPAGTVEQALEQFKLYQQLKQQRSQGQATASQKQIGFITSLLENQHGLSEEQWRQIMYHHTGKKHKSELTREDASQLIKELQGKSTVELLNTFNQNKEASTR